jgi:hypothetical protein
MNYLKVALLILAVVLLAPIIYLFTDMYLYVFTSTHFISTDDIGNKFTMAWISGVLSFLVFFFAAHLP